MLVSKGISIVVTCGGGGVGSAVVGAARVSHQRRNCTAKAPYSTARSAPLPTSGNHSTPLAPTHTVTDVHNLIHFTRDSDSFGDARTMFIK